MKRVFINLDSDAKDNNNINKTTRNEINARVYKEKNNPVKNFSNILFIL